MIWFIVYVLGMVALGAGAFYAGRASVHGCWACALTSAGLITGGTIALGVLWAT